MSLQSTKNQHGFTIVELLIVIVVIGILAAISVVAVMGVTQRGRDSERAQDTGNIVKALTTYTSDGNAWPATHSAATTALNSYTTVSVQPEVTAKLGASAASTASSSTYGYAVCPTGATGSAITGARITWVKEQDNSTVPVIAGTGCTP